MTMQIRGLTIAGLPAIEVRNALRRMGSSELSVQGFEKLFKVSKKEIESIVRQLQDGGFVEWEERGDHVYHKLTSLDLSLANASAMNRMPRSKGDQLLKQVLGRVQQINASEEYGLRLRLWSCMEAMHEERRPLVI